MHKQQGFTLVELVIVIILMGILAATAIPKLLGQDDFEPQTYRAQLIQLLKTVQQQAMSCDDDCRAGRDSNPYACNKVIITTSRYGIPSNCSTTNLPDVFSAPHLGMSKLEADNTGVQLSSGNVTFANDGSASVGGSHCSTGCNIAIIGSETVNIRIEAQGYIHAL